MCMGSCLRVSWLCLLFAFGICFPTDRVNNSTSLNSGSSAIPDSESAASSVGNETVSTTEAPEETPDSNATSASDIFSPRAFYGGPPLHTGEKSSDFSMQPSQVSTHGGFYTSSNPWFRPFHSAVYTGADSHPYPYGGGAGGFPLYNYGGVHAASLPYGYSYGTAGSPHDYAYGTGESSPSGPAYPSPHQAYDHRIPISPPFGVGPPPAFGYLPQQSSILDPELFFIGNFLMRVRKMPLAQAWMTSEVPMGMTEKSPVYPSSRVMQANKSYQRARDLLSNDQYSNSEDPFESGPETLELQEHDVPEADF